MQQEETEALLEYLRGQLHDAETSVMNSALKCAEPRDIYVQAGHGSCLRNLINLLERLR